VVGDGDQVGSFSRTSTSTLYDLAEYGTSDFRYACDATYHLRRELNLVTEYPVLLAIDDVNCLWDHAVYLLDPDWIGFRPHFIWPHKLTLANLVRNLHDTGLVRTRLRVAPQRTGSHDDRCSVCVCVCVCAL
jgi:hypothetical protein